MKGVKLSLVPISNPLSFNLTEAQLLSATNCDITVNNNPLFENGILKLLHVDVELLNNDYRAYYFIGEPRSR